MSLSYLVIGYVTRVVKLSKPAAECANRLLRTAPVNLLRRAYNSTAGRPLRRRMLSRLWRGFWLNCITLAEAFYEIGNSMLWEILWLAAALIWGTFRLIENKQQSHLLGENTWAFGQVLALLLSIAPLWAFYSTLQDTFHTPLSIDTTIESLKVVDELDPLDEYSWYNALIGLMFGTALILMGGTIFSYSAAALFHPGDWEGSDTLFYDAGLPAAIYIAAFAFSVLVFTTFTSVVLLFRFNIVSSSTLSSCWRRRTNRWSALAQRRARNWIWTCFILLLFGAELALYLGIFIGFYTPEYRGQHVGGRRRALKVLSCEDCEVRSQGLWGCEGRRTCEGM